MDDSTGVLLPESNNRNSKESFQKAIGLFLQRSTHEKKLRDRQLLIYYQPGGDFQVRKDLGTSAIEHHHRFDELLRVAELLPEGFSQVRAQSVHHVRMTTRRRDDRIRHGILRIALQY